MIMSMLIMARPQQRYDHRLRNLVRRTGDVTVATTSESLARSTARGWLGAAPTVVVCLDVADLTEPELQQEVLKLRRRVQKLPALLRLALALLQTSRFSLTGVRLPDGRAKMRILRAVDRAREYLSLRAVLRFLRLCRRVGSMPGAGCAPQLFGAEHTSASTGRLDHAYCPTQRLLGWASS